MKTIFSVMALLLLSLTFTFIVAYPIYAKAEEEEFAGLVLHKAADYAAEAAMAACMEISDVELEYSAESVLTLSPLQAADTFSAVMCIAYGIPPTERNTDEVLSKTPMMMLVENDGYYIGEQAAATDEGDEILAWHLKHPFSIERGGYTYGVEMNRVYWRRVNNATMDLVEGEGYLGLPFSDEEMFQKINRDMNRDATAILGRYAMRNNLPEYQRFYLPFSQGKAGVNRIERPTLIAVLDGISLDGGKPLSLSVVSGLKAIQRTRVVAWTDGSGIRWYAHEWRTDEADRLLIHENGEIFDTVEQAAKAGYVPKL
jgi:hypothetical protein